MQHVQSHRSSILWILCAQTQDYSLKYNFFIILYFKNNPNIVFEIHEIHNFVSYSNFWGPIFENWHQTSTLTMSVVVGSL